MYDENYYQTRRLCDEPLALWARKEKLFNLEWASKWSGIDLLAGQGRKALDAGCGIGHNTFLLEELRYEVTAIDVSDYAIQKLQTAVARLGKTTPRFLTADLDRDSLPGQFDLIICWEVIEHTHEPENVIRKLYDALLPGGVLIITTPNAMGLSYLLLDHDPTHLHVHSSFYWARLLRQLPGARIICRSVMFWDYVLPWLRDHRNALVTWLPILGFRLRIAVHRLSGPSHPVPFGLQ